MLTSSYAHIHISSYPQPQPASQPAGRPASQPGSIGRQVRFWSSKSANLAQSWQHRFFFIRVRRFLMVLGRRSAKVALKRVSSAQTRFGAPKTSKNVVHVCQSAACVTLERKELQRHHLSDLERLDPSEHQKTSYTYAKTQKWIFVTLFLIFQKNKKLQKVTFALLHTCTTFFGVLRGPNAPSRSSGAVGALCAPKSHKPHFAIRVRRFLMFLGSQNAFLRSNRVLAPLLHFGTPKPSRNVDHV